MTYILYIIIFLYGIVIGSFLNVCIYRIPKQENIISKRSHCMTCGSVLKWYELVPLFSFLFQRGKCRHCGVRLSRQYPAIEFVNGLLYCLIFSQTGFIVESILYCFCTSALLVLAVIDFRTYEIPLGCNIFILCLGVIQICIDYRNWAIYVIGFAVVSLFFLFIYIVTKGRGIGGGDIKLMAAAGLLLGFKLIILAMIIGCVAGTIIHPILMKWKRKDRILAFGPYLAFGILIAMLWGQPLITWYCGFFL